MNFDIRKNLNIMARMKVVAGVRLLKAEARVGLLMAMPMLPRYCPTYLNQPC